MNVDNLIKYLIGLGERIVQNKKTYSYGAAILIGLTFSRLVYSATFYVISQNPVVVESANDRQLLLARSQRQQNIDPQTLVGGSLFGDLPLEMGDEASVEAAEAKNFSLIGTLEGDPSYARAIIQVTGSKEAPREYAIGSKIGIARLIAIGREKIWVRINGQKVKIKVGEDTQKIAAGKGKTDASGKTITRVLSRQEVNEKIFGNQNLIYRGASFGPNLVNGKIEGYKLHRVRSDHIFYSLGARSGDIIKSVNGYELSDTERMFELWKSIKTMPRVEVQVIRNKKPMKFDFHIRN